MTAPDPIPRLPLFVDGTLLPGQPNAHLLADLESHRRHAVFPSGRLFDLGRFPMLVEGDGSDVTGLLVEVRQEDYDQVVAQLDRLEGFDPEQPAAGAFRRVARLVTADPQQPVLAWAYLGTEEHVTGQPVIESGDWTDHVAARAAHSRRWWDALTGLFTGSQGMFRPSAPGIGILPGGRRSPQRTRPSICW